LGRSGIIFSILLFSTLHAYDKPEGVKTEVWEEAKPFLFPKNHHSYSTLKALFGKRRVTLSNDSLKKSGFSQIKQQPFTKMSTALHKNLPGLFFKIYLDSQKPYKKKPEYSHWMSRIKGANLIRQLIAKNGWEDSFKVPQKWMFPLPKGQMQNPLFKPVSFVLVEEDMNLASSEKNLEMWKSKLVTREFLDRLHVILNSLGVADCTSPKNLPFSVDGRVAFIDTQTTMTFPVSLGRLSSYLSEDMADYWEKIIQ